MNNLKGQIKQINAARSQYNPLRSLTIQRVVSLLEQGELGSYRDLQWTYRMIEKRDAVLRALVRRRSAALLKLEWDIKLVPEDQLPPGATVAQAEAQALALRTLYDNIKNLKAAIKALALAEFRGYTHLEKSFGGKTSIKPDSIDALNFIKQWYWTRDGLEGDWKFDPDLRASPGQGEEIDPSALVVREVEDPINEIALIAFLRKNMSQKDWDGFVELFGIPDIFFIMPQGMTKEQQDEWLAVAEQLAGDGRGAIPNGGDVKAVGGDVRGTNPFEAHLDYQDTMIVLAGTGGKLTMLSEATGIGGGATDAHDDAFDDLAQQEAAEISEIFQAQLDLPLLNAKFPNQPVLAYFQIAAQESEDLDAVVDHALKLKQAGIDMDVEDLAERTGYKLTSSAAPAPTDPAAIRNRKPAIGNRQSAIGDPQPDALEDLRRSARRALARAVAADLKPVVDRITQILDTTSDADLPAALAAFQAEELPALAKQILADPAAAEAIADAMGAHMVNGMEEVAR